MFLHIGAEVTLSLDDIVMIFDIEKSDSRITREFIQKSKQKNTVIVVLPEYDVKSAVLVSKDKNDFLYLSPISAGTLLKRCSIENYLAMLNSDKGTFVKKENL